MSYLDVAIAVDKLANTLISGSHTETISARAYRSAKLVDKPKKRWRVARRLINGLFFWQKNHCQSAYDASIERKTRAIKKAKELMHD